MSASFNRDTFNRDTLTNERKDKMLDPIEITMEAVKTFSDPHYDNAAKSLFLYPEILAPILANVIPEYQGMSAEQVMKYIVKSSIRRDGVDSASALVAAQETEPASLGEKVIRYDSHFLAKNPQLGTKKMCIYLHIDLEMQNDYKPHAPTYPIVTRGVYYAARGLDSQLGVLTEETDYSTLQKVYSIWICRENIPPKLRGTVTSYSVEKTDTYGVSDEPKNEYDLLSVVLIRLGDTTKKETIFQYLHDFFAGDIDGMCRYINIKRNEKLAKGVNQLMTLSQSIFSRGVQEGVEKGLAEGEVKGIAKGLAEGEAKGITKGEARNFIFSVKTLMKNTKKSKEDVLAMLGKTNQDYINALQILSDNH